MGEIVELMMGKFWLARVSATRPALGLWAICAVVAATSSSVSCGDSASEPANPGADASSAYEKVIGPAGGQLVSADGRARLAVPPGALTSELTLS
ncbi:MAG: hypothetical protein IT375_03550, partial [Polyangiaceae bacterium]|nr:hypothetical protein [Polyangiaceae bacterium]